MRIVGELAVSEQMNLKNIYACVLAKGTNPEGNRCYAYFGIFLESMDKMVKDIKAGKPFNPKDYNTIVLARGEGEPDPEIREFMRRKFSFAEDQVILELSH